jgi:cation diffusion facilitator CzcD-associated flavoprotein CzcO
MRERGHTVVGFERGETLGGVWSSDKCVGRVTGQTLSSSSIANSMFSDFPMKMGSNPLYPTHFGEDDFRAYIGDYTEKFGLTPLFKTSVEVLKVERVNEKWEVTYSKGDIHKTEEFDLVTVCTGLNQEVRAIEENGNGLTELQKRIQHTSKAKDNSIYKGKKVVLVGLGESSTDTAADIADVAERALADTFTSKKHIWNQHCT